MFKYVSVNVQLPNALGGKIVATVRVTGEVDCDARIAREIHAYDVTDDRDQTTDIAAKYSHQRLEDVLLKAGCKAVIP
jgi:hypothetical protein